MPSKEEILFGKIAVESGFLTQEQVDSAVAVQESSNYARPLGVILVEQGYLTDEELAKVLDLQMQNLQAPVEHSREKKEDAIFGKLVVKRTPATSEDVNRALRYQASLERKGIFRRLGQILVELGLLEPGQVQSMLEYQRTQILVCDTCFAQFNIRDYAPGRRYRCKRCGTILAVPRRLYTVEVVETIKGWESDSVEVELAESLGLLAGGDEPGLAGESGRTRAGVREAPPVPAAVRKASASPSRAASAHAPATASRASGRSGTPGKATSAKSAPARAAAPPSESGVQPVSADESDRPVKVLGQMLVEKGLVSAEIVDRCVQLQMAAQQQGLRRTLGEILVAEGYLTQAQLDRVLAEQESTFQKRDPLTRRKLEDIIFGRLAVSQGLAGQDDINEALRQQAHIESREGRYVRLGRILVDNGVLTLPQVVRLLEYQKKRILICEQCMAQYNIQGLRPGKSYRCKKCGAPLAVPLEISSLDVDGSVADG